MSLYVGSSDANHGEKTSGVIDHNSAYTWMAWVDLVSDTNTYGHIWSAETVPNEWYNADWIGTDSDGTTLRWGAAISATETSVTGGSLSTDTPAHVCLVRSSATSLSAYLNGASAGSASTQDIAGRASTVSESLGNLSTYPCPVRLTAIKQWQAALTADEISAEMHSIRPLRLANLHSWHPAIANTLTDALKDCSGNGRDWTSQGTNTVETQSAPVSWGGRHVIVGNATVTAQYARPTSDVSAGTWTASSGSDLYAMLDETSASDSDYIVTTGASTCEVALGSLTDPASSSGHIVRYRISATSGGITVRLRQGTTTVATWVHAPAPTSLTTYAQTLTSGEADSITDYTALRLQFEATT
jgi:hypothetical protein